MKNDDARLIQRVLDGDDAAFSALVRKYQRSVHALAWRKIGDFHIAEDITQEAFLKAYQRLSTLKEPQSFASWLYVITANQCKAWLRKKRTWIQSLEDTSSTQLEKATYSGHIIAENERMTTETQREVVKELLAKLQESDRTVITLYYLGGMTYEEISNFLGVSEAAIRNRLYRARRRLKEEEPMIREALGNFQITPNLTENIMHEISRLKPIAPSGGKPLVPWAIGVSTIAIIFLMLGIGTEYLSRFQKPYSFEATSEMTVDIIETPIVLDIESKPDVRTQLGRAAAPGQNDGAGQRPDAVLFAAAQADGDDISIRKQQWVQGNAPSGPSLRTLFRTSKGEIYIVDGGGGIYKSSTNAAGWRYVNAMSSLTDSWDGRVLMAEWDNTLYTVVSNALFASTDGGKTWLSVGPCPENDPGRLVIIDGVFYLSFDTVYCSADAGKTWIAVGDGLTGEIQYLEVSQNTLFAKTTTGVHRLDAQKAWVVVNDRLIEAMDEIDTLYTLQGTLFATTTTRPRLYRLDVDSWQLLRFPVPEAERVGAFAGTENTLYAMAALDWDKEDGPALRQMSRGQKRSWWLFRSTDNGESWTDITPTNAWPVMGHNPDVVLAAVGQTILVIGSNDGAVVRSVDNGDTWTREENTGISITDYTVSGIEALNEHTFYTRGNSGIHRSIDGGKSWERFNPGTGSYVPNLIALRANNGQNPRTILYAATGREVVKSIDNGKTWRAVNPQTQITEFYREHPPQIFYIAESNGVLYAKGKAIGEEARLYRVSEDSNALMQIQAIPILHSRTLWNQLSQGRRLSFDLQDKSFLEQLQEGSSGATQFFKQLTEGDPRRSGELIRGGLRGAFAVSGDTFYMEYNYKLFRWEPGDTEWYDTEMEETAQLFGYRIMEGFKLAVSGNTVYVGKWDGHLVVSFDKGTNWIDLTPILPFPVKTFHDIVFTGSKVYVATDAGVAASKDGKQWDAITDAAGTPLIIGRLAVDGTTLYGVSKSGVYRLNNNTWKEVVSEIPNRVTSFAVEGDVLYVGTQNSGVLHFNLNE
ncbi:sigma-70 family RNA polymerase sigma factor [Candidatus Poribacteria bacterium]|nr:sigma-70 family RNA polymerase sigma factor [Candidatus Poribacteria bacterium]